MTVLVRCIGQKTILGLPALEGVSARPADTRQINGHIQGEIAQMSQRNRVPSSDLASDLDTASPAKGVQPRAGASSVSPKFAPPVTGTNICVIGGGFVGLVSAAGFAEFGHSVVCVEKDLGRLKELQAGQVPFYENELGDLIRVNLENGRLSFSNDLAASLKGQKAIFIAVGTPAAETGRTDLGALEDLIVSMAGELTKGQIVVLKSTVPVGTAERVRAMLSSNGASNKQIPVISNPEFLREGSAVYDFFHPQRIVIGGDSPESVDSIAHIHRLGMKDRAPIVVTNNATAEMIKYASNAFLATKIGFANELSGVCDEMKVNVLEVARGMGLDPRIGAEFLSPGPGWGGSCLPKDVSEYIGLGSAQGLEMHIARAVLEANRNHHARVVDKVKKLVGELSGAKIGVLGLSFKADTSDMRNSPAIPIVWALRESGAHVLVFDPAVGEEAAEIFPGVEFASGAADVADGADCILILTEWQEFQMLDWAAIGAGMRQRNLVDARNLLTPETLRRYDFRYESMGQV